MKNNEEIVPVEIFYGTIWDAEFVKSLLENAEIEAFLRDEINGTLLPFTSLGGVGSATVVVSSLDYEKAKLIVDEYEKNKEKA